MRYEKAKEILKGRSCRKVGHATVMMDAGTWYVDSDTGEHRDWPGPWFVALPAPSIAVRYHDTDVVVIHPDGTYTLDTGGYTTATTRRRIEDYAPVRISGRLARNMGYPPFRYGWMYARESHPGGPWYLASDGGIEFRDGMTVDSQGRDIDHLSPEAMRDAG